MYDIFEKIFADYNDILKSMNSVGAISYALYSALYDIGRALATTEYDIGLRDAISNIKSVVEGTSESDTTKIRQLRNFLLITEIPLKQFLTAAELEEQIKHLYMCIEQDRRKRESDACRDAVKNLVGRIRQEFCQHDSYYDYPCICPSLLDKWLTKLENE